MTRYVTSTTEITAALRDLLGRFEAMPPTVIPQTSVSFGLQICSHRGANVEKDRVTAVTTLCKEVLGISPVDRGGRLFGAPVCGVDLDHVNVDIFTGVESERERKLREENEALRAELAAATRPAMATLAAADPKNRCTACRHESEHRLDTGCVSRASGQRCGCTYVARVDA